MIKIILSTFIIFLLQSNLYSQEDNYRDPFKPLAVKDKPQGPKGPEEPEVVVENPLDTKTIEGIVWDTDMPQAIIDGDVYRVGDILKDTEAKILEIDKGVISVLYKGVIFDKFMEKKKKEEK